jgi:hypothetical protein
MVVLLLEVEDAVVIVVADTACSGGVLPCRGVTRKESEFVFAVVSFLLNIRVSDDANGLFPIVKPIMRCCARKHIAAINGMIALHVFDRSFLREYKYDMLRLKIFCRVESVMVMIDVMVVFVMCCVFSIF